MATNIREILRQRPLIRYAVFAYHDHMEFRILAPDLEGLPIAARNIQVKTPTFWRAISFNSQVHLGIRNDNILVLAFRVTGFPLTVENFVIRRDG
ncbi:hypothetical protein DM02DRAFT_620943 [Periconia macrospinosa]|uniref:Uncharacterized protein n=1 Tax=Periconia macrospinosa TaxID=97972 RepID=A0A2V1CXX9_9PLEO|nr:hypothetical protein DM02DRAFT_620943 [Periconia macrospinosa]